jgi:predicted MFS family arabinose efflux permease
VGVGVLTRQVREGELLGGAYRARLLAMLVAISAFNFADRAVFAALAPTIREDLRLSDFQLGLLQGLGFALFYATLGVPIGRMAERLSRVKILSVATGLWSVMTTVSGLATAFVPLLAARVGVGVGEAGFNPPVSSLLADHFPRERRASAMGLVLIGTPIGTLAGAVLGGAIAAHWGWRSAFWLFGALGLVFALLARLFLIEPPRGLADGLPPAASPPPGFGAFLRALGQKPALCLVILGAGLTAFGSSSISQFLAVFLARTHHLSVREAATAYGSISATFLGIGLLTGSFGTDLLARRSDPRWSAWGPAIGLLLAPFVYWLAFRAQNMAAASLLLIVGGSLLMLFYGPSMAMVSNLLEPRMRATGAAVFGMAYTLLGFGLGPTFVGFVSDRFASAAFGAAYRSTCIAGGHAELGHSHVAAACQHAAATGVAQALNVVVCIFFVSGTCYLLASRTLRRDLFLPGSAAS